MKDEKYFVYCDGILGVKTNMPDFKWVYGQVAPETTPYEYDKCVVKFEINIKKEKKLHNIAEYDSKFQSYYWNDKDNILSCRRKLFSKIPIGYNIKLDNDRVLVEIGRNYNALVKKRVMNLHGAYYLLSDLANVMLMQKGYITLYASAVAFSPMQKAVVCFAAPSTGKTLTATRLCEREGYSMIAEDVLISKGSELYSCPYTSSYRGKRSLLDSSGSIGRKRIVSNGAICACSHITDLVVLANGEEKARTDKQEVLRYVDILNGYLFNYCSSPIIKMLSYFDAEYNKDWYAEVKNQLEYLVDSSSYKIVYSKDPIEFSEKIHQMLVGEIK